MMETKAKKFVLEINAKNTVFANLFSNLKYLLMLYKDLHPEDVAAEESDLRIVLLKEDFSNDVCTDFCFRVRDDRFIVLSVMQSVLSYNALWRMFVYLTSIWEGYIRETGQDLGAEKQVSLPSVECYVIFPGERKDEPEWLSFAGAFPELGNNLDFKAKVLYGENGGIIIDQYVTFCKTLSCRIKEKGRTLEAAEEAIRTCACAGVLKEYLQAHEKEVTAILEALFNRK